MKKVLFGFLALVTSVVLSAEILAAVPTVVSVSETSTPIAGGGSFYDIGETITFGVQFSENVNVVGTPHVNFRVRDRVEEAVYNGTGSGTNTLQFSYVVTSGINDFDGVAVERIEVLGGESITSVSTVENLAPEDFADVDFLAMNIDGEAPEFDTLTVNSTAGSVSGPARYIRSGDDVSFALALDKEDTWGNNSIDVQIGVNTKTLDYTQSATGEKITGSKTTPGTFFTGENGLVQVTALNFQDQAGKNITNVSGFPIVTNIIVDNIHPVVNYTDDVSTTAVITDTVVITVADTNSNTATYEYGFSADAVCDATDTFGNSFTSGTGFVINTESNNGNYICARAVDLAGNTTFARSANPLQVDGTSPVISYADPVASGPVQSDTVTITVTDTNADVTTYEYGFSADAVCDATDIFGNAFTSGVGFVINTETNNGNYICARATDLSGNTSYLGSTHDLNVDIIDPILAYTDNVSAVLVQNDTVTITVTDVNSNTATYEYGFSADAVCDATDTFGNSFTSGTGFVINTEANNGNYICARAMDLAGNISFLLSTDVLNIDSTSPVMNYTDDIMVGPTQSDTVTITVADLNADISTYEYGFSSDAVCDGTDVFGNTFTSGVGFVINTEANNGRYICARASDTVGNTTFFSSLNPLNIDITAPVFSSIGVTSNNPFDASYAKFDSTLSFELTLSTADSFAGPGGTGQITFDIGGTARTLSFNEAATTNLGRVYTATYPLAGENGNITITNINFQDAAGNSITGFVGGAPTPTVLIDTQAPTLDTVSFVTAGNPGWAQANQDVRYTLSFSEDIRLSVLNAATIANNATTLQTEFSAAAFTQSEIIEFEVENGDNGAISINSADFLLVDRAGNTLSVNAGLINGLVPNTIVADTTAPTISATNIASNNADTTLAKTNDTITVSFTTADNLSPTVSLAGANIHGKNITSSVIGPVGPGNNIRRFTDGSEITEAVVGFALRIRDEAGNRSALKNTTDDGSQVQFDRTNPVVRNVSIAATSADNSAFLGDLPTYYAKRGDSITLTFEAKDYLDIKNLPTGNILGMNPTITKGVSKGIDGNAEWFEWTAEVTNIDGNEGTVTFDILVLDNAGNGDGATNGEVHITGTTDGSRVIFDKTRPTLPTTVNDILGSETLNFKQRDNAVFSWSGQSDPNPAAADLVSGIRHYLVRLTNPANGGENHRGSATNPEIVTMNGFDGRLSNIPDPGQTKIPARDETDPYQLRLVTVDRAGNHSSGSHGVLDWTHAPSYVQPYTIGISGFVHDESGNPVHGTHVQVAARYNEVCDTGKEICTGVTNVNGFYSIVLKKEQNYNVTFYRPSFYLYKTENRIEKDDIEQDIVFTRVESIKKVQTLDQTSTVRTDKQFFDQNLQKYVGTLIFIESLSGEITAKNINKDFDIFITSLSRITSVTSNDPNLVILDNGNNTFTVLDTGKIKGNSGQDDNFTNNPYQIGVKIIPAGGKHSFSGSRGYAPKKENNLRTWTRAEVEADNARINAGFPAKVITYKNVNGFDVFAGYQPGKLPIKKLAEKRTIVKKPRTSQAAIAFGKELKDSQQVETKRVIKKYNLSRRRAGQEVISSIAQKNHLKNKVNKFERKNTMTPKLSNMKHKYHANPMVRINGKTINMNNLVQ